jgi:hypothetical protein
MKNYKQSGKDIYKTYWEIGCIINVTDKKQRTNAPIIPSRVFLGEMPCAKGFFPKRLPKRRPPLSACQDMQNTRAI